jgi:type III secretory pathway component EscV
MIWLGISLGISLTLSFLLPFPMSLVVIIAVFVLLNFYMRRRLMQRTGTKARRRFSTDSSSFTANESSSLKYSCMNCGMQHKDISCPNCGSKIKKVVYW